MFTRYFPSYEPYKGSLNSLQELIRLRAEGDACRLEADPNVWQTWARKLSLIRRLRHHRGCVNVATWSRDGRSIITSGDDVKIVVSTFPSLDVTCSFDSRHRHNVFDCISVDTPCSVGSRIVSCSGDGTVVEHTILSARTTSQRTLLVSAPLSFSPVMKLASPPSGRATSLASVGRDGVVSVYDLRAQTAITAHKDAGIGSLSTCIFHPGCEKTLFVGSSESSSVGIFDLRRLDKPLTLFKPPDDHESLDVFSSTVTGIDVNATGTALLVSYNARRAAVITFLLDPARIDRSGSVAIGSDPGTEDVATASSLTHESAPALMAHESLVHDIPSSPASNKAGGDNACVSIENDMINMFFGDDDVDHRTKSIDTPSVQLYHGHKNGMFSVLL